jgi:hypothetical protein
MCNKSIICGVLFASGAITFYEDNNMLSALLWFLWASIEVEGKHFDLDILMGGDMKFLQLVRGLGGSLCNYSCPWHRVHKNQKRE